MADKRELHITECGNKINLDARSNDCGIDMGNILNMLCRTIAGIYLKAGRKDTNKEGFADAIRDSILRIMAAEAQEDTHCGTK